VRMSNFRRPLVVIGKSWSVLISRSLHATSVSWATAATKASPKVWRRKHLPNVVRSRVDFEEALPPISILQAASKAGAMEISAEKAKEALLRYQDLEIRSAAGWEAKFCKGKQLLLENNIILMVIDFDMKPATLVLLSNILNSCSGDKQRHLARRVMQSASELGDESATIDLVSSALRKGKLHLYAASLQQLEILAKEGKPRSMTLLGRVAAARGKDREALEWFRTVFKESGNLDPEEAGEALVCEGQILKKTNLKEAEAAFRKAALELDNPSAYFNLSQLEEEGSLQQKVYLLKAASSGISEAAHSLGSLELSKIKESDESSSPDYGMAREWFQIAAVDGFGPSMLSMARICKASGESEEGLEWLAKAKGSAEVQRQAMEMEDNWESQQNSIS
jgi:TPR repeat protein